MMLRPAHVASVLATALLPMIGLVTACGVDTPAPPPQPGVPRVAETSAHVASPVARGPVSTTCLQSDGFLDLLDTTRSHLLETVDALGPAQPPAHISSVRAAVASLHGEAATLLTLGREFADYPDCGDPAVADLLDAMGAELVTLATHLDLIDLGDEVNESDLDHLDRVTSSTARLLRLLKGLDQALRVAED